MTYDWETMMAFEKLKTERVCTPEKKGRKMKRRFRKHYTEPLKVWKDGRRNE